MRIVEQEFYDYKTAPVVGNQVVDHNRTGMPFYDDFLSDDPSTLNYLVNKRNLVGEVINMSPKEYFQACSDYGFPNSHPSVEHLKQVRAKDTETLNHLKNVLTIYKRRFPMPVLNKADAGQEGLHRMMVIGDMFGWDHKVPVLVVDWADKQRAFDEAKRKRIEKIEYRIRRAVQDTLYYKFNNIDELKEQLQWELDKQFDSDDDVSTPVQFELTSDEQTKEFIVNVGAAEYSFDYDDVKFIEPSEGDDLEDVDFEVDDDFLVRYFGDHWRETYPHLKDKFNIKESVIPLDDSVYQCAKQARDYITNKYGTETNLCGRCIEASDYLVSLLNNRGIQARTVEGYIVYDIDENCSDRAWDEHTWVELADGTVIDVTIEQFNYQMHKDYPPILIEKNPYGYVYDKPDFLWLDELHESTGNKVSSI